MSATLPELYNKAHVIAPKGEHKRTVFFLHGLGDQGESFIDVFELLNLHNTKIVLPNAPKIPISVNGGYKMPGWYDIYELGPGRDLTQKEDVPGIKASIKRVSDAIDYEIAQGIPSENILLGGFSQGSAVAQIVAAQYPKTLAGVVALSGYALLSGLPEEENTFTSFDTPFFVYHGINDSVVPINFSRQSKDYYIKRGIKNYEYHEEKGLEHSLSNSEIKKIHEFLTKIGFSQ